MGLDVEAQLMIPRTREEVAGFATEPSNDPRWISGISSARMITDPPVRVGTRVERVASFLGKRIEYVMDVIELVPGERVVLESVRSPFPMRVTYAFSERPDGTLMRIRVEGEPKGFYRLGGPLMTRQVKTSLNRDLETLRSLLEGSAQPGR
jgi:hypothetical protein